jgi:hypothetical protein
MSSISFPATVIPSPIFTITRFRECTQYLPKAPTAFQVSFCHQVGWSMSVYPPTLPRGTTSRQNTVASTVQGEPLEQYSAIPRSSGPSETNYKNYRFSEDGEQRLSQWMRSNLDYSIYPFDGEVNQLETSLIRDNEPPLNLTKWRNPQKQKIQALRNTCKAEARLIWQ